MRAILLSHSDDADGTLEEHLLVFDYGTRFVW